LWGGGGGVGRGVRCLGWGGRWGVCEGEGRVRLGGGLRRVGYPGEPD